MLMCLAIGSICVAAGLALAPAAHSPEFINPTSGAPRPR